MTQAVLELAWAYFPKFAKRPVGVLGSTWVLDPSSGICSYCPLAPSACLAVEMNLVVADFGVDLTVAAADLDFAQLNLEILLLVVESEQERVLN